MKDFIEDDEEEDVKDTQNQFYNRRNVSKFFRNEIDETSNNTQGNSKTTVVDKSTALKDDFFQNLVAQLSDEEESQGEEKGEAAVVSEQHESSVTTGKGKRKAKEGSKKSRKEAKTKESG